MAFPVIWQKLKDLAASVSGINESVSEVSESVSEVSAKVDGCLPLAGGTMSGAISASNPTGFDVGYSYSDRSGALIGLRNAGNTTYPGWFEIFARNASASSSLLGMPDGTLKWGGKNVFVGGYHTVEDTRSTSGSYTGLYVYGGRAGNGSGARLILRNKEATSEPGAFALQAHNGSSGRVFTGFPDGTLKWDGKNLVRTINSTAADAAGNVSISVGKTVPVVYWSKRYTTNVVGSGKTYTMTQNVLAYIKCTGAGLYVNSKEIFPRDITSSAFLILNKGDKIGNDINGSNACIFFPIGD